MTAHEYLSKIRDYDAKLTITREEIDSLYSQACGISSPALNSEKVQTSLAGESPQEKLIPKIHKEIRVYEETYNHYLRLRKKIIDQINRLPDWKHGRILYLTYVQGLHSPEIGEQMGYTAQYVRELRTEALDAFEGKYLQNF